MSIFKRKTKNKKTVNKEQQFVKYSTNILLIFVITFAVVFSGYKVYKSLKVDSSDGTSITALANLSKAVDTSKLISNQLSDEDKPALIAKINDAGLDIIEDNEFSYEKYNSDNLSITSPLSLSSSDVGLLYSYLFVPNDNPYDVLLYQVSIEKSDTSTTITIVSSINLYSLFTSKLDSNTNDSIKDSLPRRIYLTNSIVINNDKSYSQTLINNLSETESTETTKLIENTNTNIKLNKYVPDLIMKMIDELSVKTNSDYVFYNGTVCFVPKGI